MTENHARDDWADPQLSEALQRSLTTMAGRAAASTDLPLDQVRSRVRRRRAVKKAGVGATAFALVGGLAVGGALLMPDDPLVVTPVPAVSPSDAVSPEPGEDPSDGAAPDDETTEPAEGTDPADGSALGVIQDGFQPAWLEGTDLVCGMAIDDLDAGVDGFALEVTGELTQDVGGGDGDSEPIWRLPTSLPMPDGAATGSRLIGPTLIWTVSGRVVDVGTNMTEESQEVLAGGLVASSDAEDWLHTTCAPDESTDPAQFHTELPVGDYQVRAFYDLWDPAGTSELILSDPVDVTLPTGGGESVGD